MAVANAQFPFNVMLMQPPGHRGFRRLLQSLLRQLATVAISDRATMNLTTKIVLFRLIPEYQLAATDAAAFAASREVIVSLPDDSIVLPQKLLMMLYLDYLVFGIATFELANDVVVYADPRQFTRITLNQLGEPEVLFGENDVSERVGIIARCPNPFAFGFSVPELIPQTFLFLLSVHSKILHDLSPYRKPDLLIVTSEVLSDDELLARRRRIVDQFEEDYGTVLLYAHSSDERPQIIELSRSDRDATAEAMKLYQEQVRILRTACGAPDEESKVPYAVRQFFAALESEFQRLTDGRATIALTSEDIATSFAEGER